MRDEAATGLERQAKEAPPGVMTSMRFFNAFGTDRPVVRSSQHFRRDRWVSVSTGDPHAGAGRRRCAVRLPPRVLRGASVPSTLQPRRPSQPLDPRARGGQQRRQGDYLRLGVGTAGDGRRRDRVDCRKRFEHRGVELPGSFFAAAPAEHRLATSLLYAGYDVRISGNRLENLVGAGNLLVVGRRWQNAKAEATRSVVYAVKPRGVRRILAGSQAIWPQAVDGGRIAVLRGSALEHRRMRVEIYHRRGARQVATGLGPLRYAYRGDAIALQGTRLLVLTSKQHLEIYNSHSGRFVASWPVPRHAANLDLYGAIAVYAEYARGLGTIGGPYRLHVLDVATGKDVVLGRGEVQSARNLELDSSGLVYVKGRRTIVFVPLKRIRAAVS